MSKDDPTLINEYRANRSEAAFCAIVERHLPMVYRLALRRTGKTELAEEIAQNVFTILARKSLAGFRAKGPLHGWLYRTTLYQSSNTLRSERRRQQAMKNFQECVSVDSQRDLCINPKLQDLLDDAVGDLQESDRTIVIQRYIEGRKYGEIGRAIGKSEDTVRKRAAKALERMATYFRLHGHSIPAATLAAGLTTLSIGNAPAGLTLTVVQSALEPTSVKTLTGALISCNALVLASALFAFALPIGVQLMANANRNEALFVEELRRNGSGTIASNPIEIKRVKAGLVAKQSPSIAETLRTLAAHPNPDHAKASISAFLSNLPVDQLQAALEALPMVNNSNARIGIAAALFGRWATFDPEEALRVAATVSESSYRRGGLWGAMERWAMDDPSSAERYLAEQPEDGIKARITKGYWYGIGQAHPIVGIEKASALNDPAERIPRLQAIFQIWAQRDPLNALTHLRTMDDDARRDGWMKATLNRYAHVNAKVAVEFGKELVAEGAPVAILTDPLTQWSKEAPVDAFGTAAALPKSLEVVDAMSRMAASIDRWEVADEVLSNIAESERDIVIEGLARGADWDSWSENPDVYPEIGELVKSIGDDALRKSAAYQLKQGWTRQSKEGATAWFDEFLNWHDSQD